MPKVQFTKALQRFFKDLTEIEIEAHTVKEAVAEVEKAYPGIGDYILENNGALRKHVNIFIGEDLITDKEGLSDAIKKTDTIYIMQALSGG